MKMISAIQRRLGAVAVCVCMGGVGMAFGAAPGRVTEAYAPGEVLVRFRPNVARAEAIAKARAGGMVAAERYRRARHADGERMLLRSSTLTVSQMVQRLRQDATVLEVSPNYQREFHATVPNDPSAFEQWGLYNVGQTGGTPGADIHAIDAWDAGVGSKSVVVAVIDSGVDYLHEDLRDNMWRNPREVPGNGVDDDHNGYVDDYYGYDFAADSSSNDDSDPMDVFGHGTSIAGIIGAAGSNGVGVVGVNWRVRIMAVKVGQANGSIRSSDLLQAYEYVETMRRDHGVNIVVVSAAYGGPNALTLEREAIGALGNIGILMCTSAGNSSENLETVPFYPACYALPNIVCFAATDHGDLLSSFSNFGARSADLGAPGTTILTTRLNGGYQAWSGTSMSAGFGAGAAALLSSVYPTEGWALLAHRLTARAEAKASLAGKTVSGGRLNLDAAVHYTPVAPAPDIAVNGQQGPLTVPPGTALRAMISLQPGSFAGVEAEWYVVAYDRGAGLWYSYVYPPAWEPALRSGYTGPLAAVSDFEVFNGTLPPGGYTVYFGVDPAPDGIPQGNWIDWVDITVSSSMNQPPTAEANGPYAIDEGQNLTLSGAGSSDPNGDPLSYGWELNGDGSYDDAVGGAPTVTWTSLAAWGLPSDGTSITIGLRVSDGRGGTHTDTATLTIGNLPPTALTLDNAGVAENMPMGTGVGVFSSIDSGDTNFTYSLVAGAGDEGNASFTIAGVQLRTAASFDYETLNAYSIRVQTADGDGATLEQTFTITVADVPEGL